MNTISTSVSFHLLLENQSDSDDIESNGFFSQNTSFVRNVRQTYSYEVKTKELQAEQKRRREVSHKTEGVQKLQPQTHSPRRPLESQVELLPSHVSRFLIVGSFWCRRCSRLSGLRSWRKKWCGRWSTSS